MKSLEEHIEQTIAQLNARISKVTTYEVADEGNLSQLSEALQRLTDAYVSLQELRINKEFTEKQLKEMTGTDEFWNAPLVDKENH